MTTRCAPQNTLDRRSKELPRVTELLTLGAAAGNLHPQDARALHLGAVGRHARVAPAVADHAVGYELHSVVFVVST